MEKSIKEKRFLELLEKYRPQIYRICYGFTDTDMGVDDLVQESMIKIWNAIDQFRGDSSLSTFAYRITVNTCIYWNKKSKKARLIDKEWKQQSINLHGIADNNEVKNERIQQLRTAIQQLNKVDRSIVLLLLEECSYKEISEITGLSLSNVGVKISRIKTRLKSIMEKTKD